MSKVVLVSGASSGLGLATALYLADQGYTVYAGARSYRDEAPERMPNGSAGVCQRVYLDVSDEDSLKSVVDRVIREQGRIDVLVNCAAVIALGSVEDLSMEEYHDVINTNLYGVIRMCKQVLPHMRAQGEGLILNFSSGGGIIGIPFQSAYCSSKFAVEGFSEVLRWEVKNRGINVVVLEPGDCRSGSQNYRRRAKNAILPASEYLEDFKTVTEKIDHDEANGADPAVVAKRVYQILMSRKPKIRYNVFRSAEILLPLKMMMPTWLAEMMFFGYYNLRSTGRRK